MLNIHNTLTNYAEAYQSALEIKTEAEKTAGEKYIGITYAEEMGKIKDAFQATIEPLRTKSMESIRTAIADAHLKGVKFGRPRCTVEGWDTYYPQWKQGQITAVQCYKQLGISASTFYRLVRKYELEDESE